MIANNRAVCNGQITELASWIERRFLNRTDVLAYQPPWGTPSPTKTGDDVRRFLLAHLAADAPEVDTEWQPKDKKPQRCRGRFRLGTYSPAPDGTTIYGCVDCDGGGRHKKFLDDPLGTALQMLQNLENLGIDGLLEKSGSGLGFHVWLLLDKPVAAVRVRQLLLAAAPKDALLNDKKTKANPAGGIGIEIFPKQDEIDADGVGNMVWLPLWHGGKNGGGQFCRVNCEGDLTPYVPDLEQPDYLVTEAEVNQVLTDLEREKWKQTATNGRPRLSNLELAKEAFSHLSAHRADSRDFWIKMGHAAKEGEDSAAMRDVWDEWAAKSPKHKPGDRDKWDTFNPKRITFGSLIHYAEEDGYVPPWKLKPKQEKKSEPKPKPAPSPEKKPEPVFLCAANITPVATRWLWDRRIPFGSLTLLDGDPGKGKSTITVDSAARVSRGMAFPGEEESTREPGNVLLLSAEDKPDSTIRPRLDAAAADNTRVHILDYIKDGDTERPPVLPWDMDLIEPFILKQKVKLVVVDPFMAYLDGEIDAHKDQDVRRCLHKLKRLAERTGIAILLVRHLNKLNHAVAMYRGGGSIGIIGAVRSALIVGQHPDQKNIKVLASTKSNLGPRPASLMYEVQSWQSSVGECSRIAWAGECDLTADDILGQPTGSQARTLNECVAAMLEYLDGGPKPSKDLDEYLKALGHSVSTVKRARKEAKVIARRSGGIGENGAWMVYPPQKEQEKEDTPIPE